MSSIRTGRSCYDYFAVRVEPGHCRDGFVYARGCLAHYATRNLGRALKTKHRFENIPASAFKIMGYGEWRSYCAARDDRIQSSAQ